MRLRTVLASSAIVVFAIAGCSKEQRRDLGEIDVRDSLHSAVEKAVEDKGLDIDGDRDCTADLTPEGAVSASCNGTTTDGQAVTGSYEGTGDVDKEKCTATLKVTIGEEEVVNQPGVSCFS